MAPGWRACSRSCAGFCRTHLRLWWSWSNGGRLARFGVEHLDMALAARGRRVPVVGPGETAGDLVRDMIEVVTSLCVRRCGRRGARTGRCVW